MRFSAVYTIILVLCAGAMAKKNKTEEAGPKKPDHTAENWMIYGPILVAILLILSCVFSCKLRNWYRMNQIKSRIKDQEKKEQPVVVAVLSESNDAEKEASYRLLTPDYRPQTPSTLQTSTLPHNYTSQTLPLRAGNYTVQAVQARSLPGSRTGTYHHAPASVTSENRQYLLVTDSENASRDTTLTRNGRD